MYHTPDGDRILLGAERELFTQSLAMIVDLLAEDDMESPHAGCPVSRSGWSN